MVAASLARLDVRARIRSAIDHRVEPLESDVRRLRRTNARLRARLATVEREVQEARRLNRRLAEVTDVVQELLVPAMDRDDERVRQLVEALQDPHPRQDSSTA